MHDDPINSPTLMPHQITRIRRETRRRQVRVSSVEQLTPMMRRIHFASADLHDFESLGVDDHVKLIIPGVGTGEGKPAMRDYTPRAFDSAAGTLVIDFALHGAGHEVGPATAWAMGAVVGDSIEIGGPRGSAIVADDFDWYLLIGDETALPSIGRRLASLRPRVPVTSIVSVDSAADRQAIPTDTDWTAIWIARDGRPATDPAPLLAALGPLPAGDGYIWIAAEAGVAKALKAHVLDALGHKPEWLKAAGYWQQGESDSHVNLDK